MLTIALLSTLYSLLTVSLLIGCDLWMKSMSDFIEEATGEARAIEHYFLTDSFQRTDGWTAIPVNATTEIHVDMRNPQGYDLELWVEGTINGIFVDKYNPPDPSEVKISLPDPNMQYAIVTITNPDRLDLFDLTITGTFKEREMRADYELPKMKALYFDNNLASLSASLPLPEGGGILKTGFNPEQTLYEADIKKSVSNITVQASVPTGAEYVFSSYAIVVGSIEFAKAETDETHNITLINDNSDVKITVTADCGRTKDYIIRVTKAATHDYTVTFDGNGHTDGEPPAPIPQDKGLSIKIPSSNTLTKTGYNFITWNTQKDGKGTDYDVDSDYTVNDSTTLYAQWEAKDDIVVSFNTNAGTDTISGDSTADKTVTFDAVYGALPAITRTGYTLDGWYTAAAGGSLVTTTTIVKNADDHTLYARWSVKTSNVTITCDPAEGGNVTGGGAYTFGSTVTLTATPATGYSLESWEVTSGGATLTTTDNKATFTMPDNNVSITAKFTPNDYNVTLAVSGNIGGTVTGGGSKTFNSLVEITAEPAAGYTFSGWTVTAGSGITFIPDNAAADASFFMPANHVTITASFSAVPKYAVNITVPVNGIVTKDKDTAAAGETVTLTVTPDTGYQLSTLTVTGSSGNISLTNTDTDKYTFTMPSNAVTVTGTFTPLSYNFTMEISPFSAGTTTPAAGTSTRDYNSTINISATPATGYKFENWTRTAGIINNAASSSTTFTMPAGNATVTANFKPISYTVKFMANGGTDEMEDQSRVYNDGERLPSQGFVAPGGKNFANWNTAADGTGTSYVARYLGNLSSIDNDVVILYAQWSDKDCTIVFNGNGNTGGTPPPTQYENDGEIITMPSQNTLVKTGHTFGGWIADDPEEGTLYAVGSASYTASSGIHNLYAKWIPNTNTVTLNVTDGGGTSISPVKADNKYDYGSTLTITATPAANYNFTGWTVVSGGVTLADASSATTTFTMPDNAVTVRANFAIKTYTVTYYGNSNTSGTAPSEATYNHGATVTVAGAGTLARTNYVFDGWNTQANGSGANYAAGATFEITGNVSLYAKWTPEYTVTFMDGSTTVKQVKVKQGGTVGTANMPTLTKTGYTLSSWNTQANGSGTAFTGTTTVSASIMVYAQWTANTYTVTFNANATGGNVIGPSPASKSVTYNSAYGDLATISRAGHSFNGWYTAATGGTKVETTTTVTTANSHTLYAQWTPYEVTFVVDSVIATIPVQADGTIGNARMPNVADRPAQYNCKITRWFYLQGITSVNFTGTTVVNANLTVTGVWGPYELGETGPGGGKIYYRDSGGFSYMDLSAGSNKTGYYLEAAPIDISTPAATLRWASSGKEDNTYLLQPNRTGVGEGSDNTLLIIMWDANAPAAKACMDYVSGGKSDWWLPSLMEMAYLAQNKSYVGNLVDPGNYWTSTQLTSTQAYVIGSSGSPAFAIKSTQYRVRPVRAF